MLGCLLIRPHAQHRTRWLGIIPHDPVSTGYRLSILQLHVSVYNLSELGLLFFSNVKISTQRPDYKNTFLNRETPFPCVHSLQYTIHSAYAYFTIAAFHTIYFLASATSKAGIRVWASQNENTSFGPVMRSCNR